MALARVQATAKVVGTGVGPTVTFSTPPTVGNGIVLQLALWNGNAPGSVTDTHGNTYVRAGASGTARAQVWYCAKLGAAGAPFTITLFGLSDYWAFTAVEVSGVGDGLQVDQVAALTTGSSATPTTGTTSAFTASEVFAAAVMSHSASQTSITVGAATPVWVEAFEELSSAMVAGEGDTRVIPSAAGTTTSCSWTGTAGGSWAALLVGFRASGTPAAVATAQTYVWGPV